MKNFCLFLIGIVLIILSAIGFIFGIVSFTGNFNNSKFEFPLSVVNGIAVDKEGRIYFGLGFYSRIQVYDQKGKFLKSWYIDASQGGFVIDISKEDYLLVETYRNNKKYHYTVDGRLLKAETIEEVDIGRNNQIYDRFGNEYQIKRDIIGPNVIKKSGNSVKFTIRTPWYLWFMQFPFPSFALGIIGILLFGYFLFFVPIHKTKSDT